MTSTTPNPSAGPSSAADAATSAAGPTRARSYAAARPLGVAAGLVAALLIVIVALLVVPGATPTHDRKLRAAPLALTATVEASGGATLATPDGHPATRVPHGRYTITLFVNSSTASFSLTGPAVRHVSPPHFVGAAIWGVRLRKGIYRYGSRARPDEHILSVY